MLRPRIILFLSTGDTCRSPMAAAYLRHLLDKYGVRGVEVRTAGVSTIVGLLASQETIQVLRAEGLDATRHRSNQLSSDMLRRATLVLGMTPFHVQSALRLHEEARGKVHLLKEYTKSDLKKVQIDDPMGGTLEIYRRCYAEIKAAIDRLILMPEAIGTDLGPRIAAEKEAETRAVAKAAARARAKTATAETRAAVRKARAAGPKRKAAPASPKPKSIRREPAPHAASRSNGKAQAPSPSRRHRTTKGAHAKAKR